MTPLIPTCDVPPFNPHISFTQAKQGCSLSVVRDLQPLKTRRFCSPPPLISLTCARCTCALPHKPMTRSDFRSNTLHWLCWLTVLMEGSRTTSLDQSTAGDVTKEAECKQMVSLGRVLPWVCGKKCFKLFMLVTNTPWNIIKYQHIMKKKTVCKSIQLIQLIKMVNTSSDKCANISDSSTLLAFANIDTFFFQTCWVLKIQTYLHITIMLELTSFHFPPALYLDSNRSIKTDSKKCICIIMVILFYI